MKIAEVKKILLAAGVPSYAMVEVNDGPDFSVSFDDLPETPKNKAAMKRLEGHFDVSDKGFWFFAA